MLQVAECCVWAFRTQQLQGPGIAVVFRASLATRLGVGSFSSPQMSFSADRPCVLLCVRLFCLHLASRRLYRACGADRFEERDVLLVLCCVIIIV